MSDYVNPQFSKARPERRYRDYLLAWDSFEHFFPNRRDRYVDLPVFSVDGAAVDIRECQVVGVVSDFSRQAWVVRLYHQSFDAVEPGEQVPLFQAGMMAYQTVEIAHRCDKCRKLLEAGGGHMCQGEWSEPSPCSIVEVQQ